MKANLKKTIGISLTLLLIGGSVASAGQRSDNRHGNQKTKIQQGIRTGKITLGEAKKLKNEQARIHKAGRHATADGHITWRERQRLRHMRDRADRNIYVARHNSRKTWPVRGIHKKHHTNRSYRLYPDHSHRNDWFYFGGHIAQPGWGFGWSSRSGF